MRKYSCYFILFTLLSFSTLAQELPYAFQHTLQPVTVVNGSGFPVYNVNEVFVDAAGNTYTTGFFRGTCDFDPGPAQVNLISPSVNDEDAFLAKYDPAGNLLYVKAITDVGNARGNDLLVTAGGKVLVVGQFSNIANVDPTASNFMLTSQGGTDGFFARFDATTGNFEAAASSGSFGNDAIREITRSGTQTYVSGTFQETVNFDLLGGTFELTAPLNTTQYFVSSYGDAFNLIWARDFTSATSVYGINSIASDATGVYLTGPFGGTIDFDPSAATLSKTSAGVNDVWISKFDISGNLVWNQTFGGTGNDLGIDLTLDASSNVFVTGHFTLTTDLDPSGTVLNATSAGDLDAFVSKFDSNGALLWARTWGGTTADYSLSIASLSTGSIVVSGRFNSPSFDADPGAGTNTLTRAFGDSDGYFSAFNTSGALLFAYSFGSSNQSTSGNYEDAQVRSNGDQVFSLFGSFNYKIDFDPTSDVGELTAQYIDFQQGYLTRYALLSTLPAAQPTGLVLSNQTGSSIDVSFTGSGADGYVVVRRSNAASVTQPKDGKTYNSSNPLNDGIIAYIGPSTSFTDVGLAANTNYFYTVYAFNNTAGAPNYRTSTPLAGNSATTSITYSRTTDSLALVAFYNATNGPAWTTNTNWLVGYIDTWHGVKVAGNRVTDLTLGSNLLTGSLPPAIGNLTALDTLELWSNQLTGNIPTELGNLTSLRYIDLSPNQFTGNIPGELGNLSLLETLWINNNKLTGSIPATLGNLSSLENLYMMGNQLTGNIPPQLGNLTSLILLDISNNLLTGNLPIELGNLNSLVTLQLTGNQLTGNIPMQLGSLAALQTLRLDQNQLTGNIPIELGDLSTLQNLYLNGNLLTGTIPSQLGNLSSLLFMDLGGNQLTGTLPASLFSIPGLQTLGIARNQLTGSIPVEITTATNLAYFWADSNQFTGSFPAMTSSTNPAIDGLTIDRNQLTGLPNLSSLNGLLSYFDAYSNNFTFEDLEANAGIGGINYAPQNNVGLADTLTLNAGDPLNLSYVVGGSANIYEWYLNGVIQPAYTTNSVAIPAAASINSGNWELSVTNSLVPSLTISSNIVRVLVKAEGFFTWADGGDLTADGGLGGSYAGSWGDYDNDGFEDIFTMGFSDTLRNYLYKNNGDGTFARQPAGNFHLGTGRNVTWADYNNDGFIDVFVPNQLGTTGDGFSAIYKNLGNGTFEKISLTITGTAASWADIDSDGDLDLAVTATGATEETFLRNNGNDVFEKVDNAINEDTQWTPYFIDVNNDNRLDYYITSVTSNAALTRLFINEGGFASFYEYSMSTTYSGSGPRGASWADIDNDGDYDLYLMLSSGGPENMFYINDGNGYLMEELGSVRLGEVVRGGRGSAFADLNNDGFVDLITYQNTLTPNGWTVFINNGDGTFTRELNQTFKESGPFEGTSLADYDNDGFIDMMAATFTAGTPFGLYKNNGNSNHWLKIKLQGSTSNRNGIGARIAVKADGFWRHHQVITTNGFANQNSLVGHFGLGSSTQADSIVVDWPSGYHQVLLNSSADQVLTINEPLNPISDTDMEVISSHQIRALDAESFTSLVDFTLNNSDDALIAGFYYGTVDFDPGVGTTLLTSGSDEESFIAKYSPNGLLSWAYAFPDAGTDNSLSHETIAGDNSGNVLIGGGVRGTYDVDPGAGVINLTSNVALQQDPYFAKYNAAGVIQWAKQLLSTTSDNDLDAVVTDAANNIIIAGSFSNGSIDMDPSGSTATVNSSDSYEDVFIGKYDSDGNYLWSLKIGTDGIYEYSPSLTTDSQNNIYLSYSIDDVTGRQVISKYDPSGAQLWSVTNQNTSNAGLRDLKLEEATNRLYAMGEYENTPSFTGTSGSGTLPSSGTNTDVGFVAAYDLNGAFINAFGFPTSNESYAVSVNALDDGNLLITGGFEGTADLDPSAGIYETYYPESSFITKITPDGTFIWAANIPNSYGLVSELNSQNELTSVLLYANGVVDAEPGPGVLNITTVTNEEEFSIIRYDIQGGVLGADSLALEAFYNATGGPNWTNNTNWLSGNVSTWFGVTVTNDRITAISLPNNNLIGSIPDESLILNDITTLNLSNNNLVAVPDLSALNPTIAVDISANNLDFGSLEYNMDVTGINYLNQKPITIAPDSILVASGEDYILTTNVGGTSNAYQWQRNAVNVTNAIADSIVIENIGRSNMGSYTLSVTNSLVPGLTLNAVPVNILATANLSGKLLMPTAPATAGYVRLLRVTSSNGYDTVRTQNVNATGDYTFNQVVLDDYQIVGFADTLVTGQERALPTYYESTIYWEEADTLFIENSLSDLNIVSLLEPTEPLTGSGEISGVLQEDDGTGSRTEKTRRVGGAGVSARRAQSAGRGAIELGELVAYVFTDEEGLFSMPGLTPGIYRINIQYPGYPMDPNSFIDITIGSSPLDERVSVEALVAEGKITVRELIITHLEGDYLTHVYPNPTSGHVTITFDKVAYERTVTLMDTQGRDIVHKEANEKVISMDMNTLEPGLYLIKVIDAGQNVKTIRISVQ